ncbi:hypothetical protein DVK01_18335 [Haloarcula sp. Atlit-120R]|nr:hypothetical protein DVK01_18335 [Haloarcula sp. Atlit-120R]
MCASQSDTKESNLFETALESVQERYEFAYWHVPIGYLLLVIVTSYILLANLSSVTIYAYFILKYAAPLCIVSGAVGLAYGLQYELEYELNPYGLLLFVPLGVGIVLFLGVWGAGFSDIALNLTPYLLVLFGTSHLLYLFFLAIQRDFHQLFFGYL